MNTTTTRKPRATPTPIVARSDALLPYRYSVETQAPAGNWVQCLGTDSLRTAQMQAAYCRDSLCKNTRIVDEHR